MAAPSRARCPTCRTSVATDPADRPTDFPFCSERCRLQDLHRWFSGDYAIPVRPDQVEPDELERLASEAGVNDGGEGAE